MARRLRILVSGMLAGVPNQGGASWAVLQYILGFQRLGHQVTFVEPIPTATQGAGGLPLAASRMGQYFQALVKDFHLQQCASLWRVNRRETLGLPWGELENACRQADVFINISGILVEPDLTGRIPVRIYLDLDPAFTQLWQAVQGIDMRFGGHTHHMTVGQAIGSADSTIPTCGIEWLPMIQPIVLEHWPQVKQPARYDAFTTVGHWRGYGSVQYEGVLYGQKVHSFRRFMDLPRLSGERVMAALAIHEGETKDLAELRASGWDLLDPDEVAGTPTRYREFVQSSLGELGIAKSGYVASRCGWFSDRSACYLASGRPVVAQETGLSQFLPTGEGLLTFVTMEELIEAMRAVRRDYDRHARAARQVALEYLDSNRVLRQLLRHVGIED